MNLSIVIGSLNDTLELNLTIKSILDTVPEAPQIIVVDDCSGCPVWIDPPMKEMVELIHNRHRCGVGPSRHIGALRATGDWLLFTDSHMRFVPGWYEAAKQRLNDSEPSDLFCASCLQIDRDHMDVSHPMAEYNGATYNWLGPDRQNPKLDQILECVWLPPDKWVEDGGEIPAIMGAGYFMSRSWYYRLGCLRFLRSWGGDEIMLAMKTWLAGGRVRTARTVKIAHKFPAKGDVKWFNNPFGHVLWNKALAAWSLFPPKTAAFLEERLLKTGRKEEARDREACKAMIRHDWHIIAQEIERNKTIFVRDAKWLADKFGLQLPQ